MRKEEEQPQSSPAHEQLIAYQKEPTEELASELLRQYEPLVQMAGRKLSRNQPNMVEDLLQVGRMVLLRLFESYDPTMGVQFEAYAMKSIVGYMKNYLRDKSWYIQVPRRMKEKGKQVQKAVETLTVRLERSPDVYEIAEEMEISVEEAIELLAAKDAYSYVSLDHPVKEEDASTTLGDLLGAPDDDYGKLEHRMDLKQAIMELKEEERKVISLVFIQEMSQRAAAQELGISQMSVSRIQRRAIGKLKKLLDQPDEDSVM
ncbi:sigma-70 family RNA polymerase sigma factor [Marinicrinis sediminis]|uniref:Sigma-70 family RNA polymerase sigma factor n=1 Tax=Marinicrinis sediminis TaxID=1652465 RepID=A0ABW5R977_9BACL